MPKLTQELIDALSDIANTGELTYWDSELPGFGLRITDQEMRYIIEYQNEGVTHTVGIGSSSELSIKLARQQASALLDILNCKMPQWGEAPSLHNDITLQEVLDKYLAVRTLRPSTQKIYPQVLKRCLGDWLREPITNINKSMVESRHRELCKPTRFGTTGKGDANHAMKILRALLNFASDYYENEDGSPLIVANPVKRLSQSKRWYRLPPRQTLIPDHKLADWYSAVISLKNRTASDYLLLVLLTGLRRNEASTLCWSDIDFDSRVLRVRAEISKNHREHRLPVSNFLYKLLRRREAKRGLSKYVFPGRTRGHLSAINLFMKEVRIKSGCAFTIHDLRRTFLTMAERLDVPHYALRKLANHVSGSDVTSSYLVTDVERLRPHMARVTDQFLALLFPDMHP